MIAARQRETPFMQNTAGGQYSSGIFLRSLSFVFQECDWWLVAATAFLLIVGLQTLQFQGSNFHDKQLQFLVAGVFAAIAFWRTPYLFWTQKFVLPILYVINLIFLAAVMSKLGHSALGAQRWLQLGPITLQPSEMAKLVVIFTLSAWLGRHPIRSFWDCFKALAIIAIPAVLVFKQPDLGTSLTFGAVYIGTIFWAGAGLSDLLVLTSPVITLIGNALSSESSGALASHGWLIFVGVLGVWLLIFWRRRNWRLPIRVLLIAAILTVNLAAGYARPHLWGVLKEYQQKRLTSFVNPYIDPRGSGYHILQSLIAIGSGGIQGTGLGKGNQSQGAFIPERHTDFIFSVVGEELGFRISELVIVAYAIICLRAVAIAYQSREEPVGSLMAIGFMCMFLFHVFLNIGMTMGIMPVAGVPLPFLSYGGTALIIDMIGIGILNSIRLINPPPRKDVWK
jgi:rod shape determining protein RodA